MSSTHYFAWTIVRFEPRPRYSGRNGRRMLLSFSHAQVSARPCNNKEAPLLRPPHVHRRLVSWGSFWGGRGRGGGHRRASCRRALPSSLYRVSDSRNPRKRGTNYLVRRRGRTPVWSDERIGARWGSGRSRERRGGPRPLPIPNIDRPASFTVFRSARSLRNALAVPF